MVLFFFLNVFLLLVIFEYGCSFWMFNLSLEMANVLRKICICVMYLWVFEVNILLLLLYEVFLLIIVFFLLL